MPVLAPHQQGIAIIERLVADNIGGSLEATADCNQCSEVLSINMVEGITGVRREKRVGVGDGG